MFKHFCCYILSDTDWNIPDNLFIVRNPCETVFLPCMLLQFPDPKEMQINLTGFLNPKNARIFLGELWDLLLSAQENIGGIPAQFLEQKKEEIKKRQV